MIPDCIVGLDPGVHTGFAIWSIREKCLKDVQSTTITQAMSMVKLMHEVGSLHSVIFEDARMRTWFGTKGKEALQGAGSIKRDCQIIAGFLGELGIPYKAMSPKDKGAKLGADLFAKLTGWTGRTNEHGRDAAMLIFRSRE